MKFRIENIFFFAIGVAVGASLPVVVPAVAEAGRPLVKALLKHGMIGLERLKTQAARTSEAIQDLLAEVQAEVNAAMDAAPGSVRAKSGPDAAVQPAHSSAAVSS